MASSLRKRLLLSYGLLIALIICIISLGSLISLLRNPLIYEGSALRLRNAQRVMTFDSLLFDTLPLDQKVTQLQLIASQNSTRMVLVNTSGDIIFDSEAGSSPAMRTPLTRMKIMAQRNEITFLRDVSNRMWLVLVQEIDPQTYLMMAVKRPRLAVVELFTNDFLRPTILASLIGLGLAIAVAIAMANWISKPLKRIGEAADAVAAGNYEQIPLEGPDEVRRLASSFNSMSQRVRDALESQRELVANVSHELKTPLTSIQGFTQAIMDGVIRTPEEIRQAIGVISTETNRMSRLVQDLVTLARLETKTGDLLREPVDLVVLTRDVLAKFTPMAAKANLNLQLYAPELLSVTGDGDQIVQVLSNLVDNAIKYTPNGGSVNVNLAPQVGGGAEIRIADTGIGIAPADRERIFQRFYRADHSQPGTGLGLAIAKQIVLAHGGEIHVEENQPHGSVFVVNLPA